jgi:hypothetical protein
MRPIAAGPRIRDWGEMADRTRDQLISWTSLAKLRDAWRVRSDENLSKQDSASTLFRFFRSKHVLDLQLILLLAISLLCIHFLFVTVLAFVTPAVHLYHHLPLGKGPNTYDWAFTHGLEVLTDRVLRTFVTYFAPAVPVYGAIVAWAYLTAATRLGVVDLFACEIGTLCRVGTAFDISKIYLTQYERWTKMPEPGGHPGRHESKPPKESKGSVSQEEYFPVFASNSHDLEALEALVVGNITEFYTYMKAARDLQRKLADDSSPEAAVLTLENLIYVLFLAYESGRKAIKDLVEFEPTRAENIIVILITELPCYAFLRKHFEKKHDRLRLERLKLREATYNKDVPDLYLEVRKHWTDVDWVQAVTSIPALEQTYQLAFDETLEKAAERMERNRVAPAASMAAKSRPRWFSRARTYARSR